MHILDIVKCLEKNDKEKSVQNNTNLIWAWTPASLLIWTCMLLFKYMDYLGQILDMKTRAKFRVQILSVFFFFLRNQSTYILSNSLFSSILIAEDL